MLDISQVPDLGAMKADILSTAEGLGADAGVAREDVYRKSKRVVVFDMDGTLVVQEVIDTLAERAGVADEVSAITKRAMEGEIDFEDALRQRVRLLKGLSATALPEVVQTLNFSPGAEETIRVLKQLGYKLGILSGGFTFFVEAIKTKLKIDYAAASSGFVSS